MTTTLVLGYDGSECAKLALEPHRRPSPRLMPGAHRARRVRLRVLDRLRADGHGRLAADDERRVRRPRAAGARATASSQVAEAARCARGAAGVHAETLVEEGKPVEVLLQAGQTSTKPRPIVVGSHGEGAMSAAFLGSTALKLLHHSEVPVLVVPQHKKS